MNVQVVKKTILQRREYFSRKLFLIFNYIFLALVTLAGVIPIISVLCMSFSSNKYVAAGDVFLWPKGFTITPYEFIIKSKDFYTALFTSVKMVVLAVAIVMLCTIMVAYPLSKTKREFRGRNFFIWFFIVPMLFNGGLVPWFMIIKYMGLYDTIWALVVPPAVQTFYVLLLMNFIKGLPKEIEESAFIDGAGHFRTLINIVLPLCKPVLATVLLFTFVIFWNNWFDSFVLMSNKAHYTLQTYLYTVLTVPDVSHMTADEIRQFFNVNQRSIKSAEIFVASVPIFILYPFMQKYFTKGIVLGSVKG